MKTVDDRFKTKEEMEKFKHVLQGKIKDKSIFSIE